MSRNPDLTLFIHTLPIHRQVLKLSIHIRQIDDNPLLPHLHKPSVTKHHLSTILTLSIRALWM